MSRLRKRLAYRTGQSSAIGSRPFSCIGAVLMPANSFDSWVQTTSVTSMLSASCAAFLRLSPSCAKWPRSRKIPKQASSVKYFSSIVYSATGRYDEMCGFLKAAIDADGQALTAFVFDYVLFWSTTAFVKAAGF